MNGNNKILTVLNSHLADEPNATDQYRIQSEMCANLGYIRLFKAMQKQAMYEIHHAELQLESDC